MYARIGSGSLLEDVLPARLERSYIGIVTIGVPLRSSPSWEVRAEAGAAKHGGTSTHWEAAGLLLLRWHDLPWDEQLDTSLGIGDGLSYATGIPVLEARRNSAAARLLNLLVLEASFPLEGNSRRVVVRLHHRSGVYGLFRGVYAASNYLVVGLEAEF